MKKGNSRALGPAFGVTFVSVARAFILVAVSPRRNTLAFFTANSAVLQAPLFLARFTAPRRTFGITESCTDPKKKKRTPTMNKKRGLYIYIYVHAL